MARAARDAGFAVHVATNVAAGAEAIRKEGFMLHPIPFARGKLAPLSALKTVAAIRSIHRKINPVIVHHVALQPAILGSIATIGRDVASLNALTGLGYMFTSNRLKARFLRNVLRWLARVLFNRRNSMSLVQNPDDRDALMILGVDSGRIALIPGSGVDIEKFAPSGEREGRTTIAFAGRLLEDKGVRTLVKAQRQLWERGIQCDLLIAGAPDPGNPTSIGDDEIASWQHQPGVTVLGHIEHVSELWQRSHIAALPSRREGLPMSLLEAAACGRPMVATDVPGCREVVKDGETGFLVPADNATALAQAIERLAISKELRARMGASARKFAVEHFSSEIVGNMVVTVYDQLLNMRAAKSA